MSSCPATDNVLFFRCFVTGTVSQCLLVLFLMFHNNYGPVPRPFHRVPPFFFCRINCSAMPIYPVIETVSQCLLVPLQNCFSVALSCYRNCFAMSTCPVTGTISICLLVLLQITTHHVSLFHIYCFKLFPCRVKQFCCGNCATVSLCPVTGFIIRTTRTLKPKFPGRKILDGTMKCTNSFRSVAETVSLTT